MVHYGKHSEMQFLYWDRSRRGKTQSEIASEFGISRQAVNKSVKLQERQVMLRLLDTAQDSGILVESYDERNGFLIGISPQLDHLLVILLIDHNNRIRVFYDQEGNRDPDARSKLLDDLRGSLIDSLGMDPGPIGDIKNVAILLNERRKDR